MTSFQRSLPALLLAMWVLLAAPARAESPGAPGAADVRELEQRFEALERQVDQLETAQGEAARRDLMQQNWRAMQDYMGFVHRRFGAGAPWMVHSETNGGPGASACPMLGGEGAAWPLPEGVTPEQYGERWRAHLRTLDEQMAGIARATDAKERQRRLKEHWQSMYREMQEQRGMGWMWGGVAMKAAPDPRAGRAAPHLPDPESAGAKLVSQYCVQCHAAPAPTLLTAAEWSSAINRMHLRSQSRGTVVQVPSDAERESILAYMKQHAR